MKPIHLRKQSGFTLIELLVVIAIIAILAAILFPVFVKARDRAKLAKCMSNLKECGVACLLYCDDNDDQFPVGRITNMQGQVQREFPEGQCVGGNYGVDPTAGKYSPPKFKPLNKYIKSIELFHCPSEYKQDCARSYTTPWLRFGNSYNFNAVYRYPDETSFVYCLNALCPNGKFIGRKRSVVRHTSKVILMGERGIHYWEGVREGTPNPTPMADQPYLGHASEKPWTPIVFCDGHVSYEFMKPGLVTDRWIHAEPEWPQ